MNKQAVWMVSQNSSFNPSWSFVKIGVLVFERIMVIVYVPDQDVFLNIRIWIT